jgi:bis(5'-nucleosyl)-tetraphosphatase (symmetrical)
MSVYAIGDIQGCYEPLMRLLALIEFDADKDQLWIAGDLVNRGPNSLEVLRFIRQLGDQAKVVLGNHDLHLLAVACGAKESKRKDTLDAIFKASDREELIHWLHQQPLIHHDKELAYTMVHAGIPPQWSLAQAQALADEVASCLRGPDAEHFLHNMYGNTPDCWDNKLRGTDRLRMITNYLTRMRFCSAKGKLDLINKQGAENAPANMKPWYAHHNRKTASDNILFGHWAALLGHTNTAKAFALDTGCVWGQRLSAMRLNDQQIFSVSA